MRRFAAAVLRGCLGLTLLPAAAADLVPGAYVTRQDAALSFGNRCLELSFQIADGRCVAKQLANRLADRTIPLAADEFSFGLEERPALGPGDFTFQEAGDEPLPAGKRLTLRFAGAAAGQRLDIIYELGDSDAFLRRRLELTAGAAPLPLRKVDVWRVNTDGACSHQGFGEPVFLDDTFWGLEFPAGHNHHAAGVVTLSQHPGRTVAERFVSKTAVLGVAESGRVADRFLDYVASFAVTPKALPLFVNYNTWWTLMPPTEQNCLELIATFRQRLFEPHGESIDTFTIDDGWDNKDSLWAIRTDRFPQGFTPLLEPLRAIRANLGLWLSPSSGYSHAPWGAANGYEQNSNAWFLCQSGPKYRRDIVPVVTGLQQKYELAFFKFDGFSAACEAEGHGHLPGPFAQEANVEAFIELLTAVRQGKPNIYLDPTCGIWLSPWWLRYADSLWGSVSGDYPDIIVPAPIVRDSATTTRDGVFRQRCREHPGYPPAAIEHLGIIVITPEKWEDNAMIVLGRGARLLTLYINPKFFQNPDRDWAFLASILKWARHRGTTLQPTRLVLGDPLKREPYGYAHFRGDRGIVALRNPFIEPCRVSIKLDETAGWQKAEAGQWHAVRIVYPRHEVLPTAVRHGDALELDLQGYEVLLAEINPAEPDTPLLAGARCRQVSSDKDRVVFETYGRAGQRQTVSLAGAASRAQVSVDGQPATSDQERLALEFPGTAGDCRVEGGTLAASEAGAAWEIKGQCRTEVPAGAAARVLILCEPRSAPVVLDGQAQVDGSAVEVRAVRPPNQAAQTHGQHTWTWFEFDVPAGKHEVSVTLRPRTTPDAAGSPAVSTGFLRADVGWWLWAEHALVKRTVTLQFAEPIAPARPDPLPLPIGLEHERQIVPIQAPQTLRAGSRWPAGPAAFQLNDVPPDECTQDWGQLQRNQSVWEKPMLVAGQSFARGLGTHANSRIVYDVSGAGFKTFRAVVGRDGHAGDGRIVFEVWLDGQRRFDSGPMTNESAAKPVAVDVTDGKLLELRTLDGGDGISGDHGNWADAQLARE